MTRVPGPTGLFIICAWLIGGFGGAWAAPYQVAPTPDWVKPIAVDSSAAVLPKQLSDGMAYLLLEHDVRVEGSDRVSYRRKVVKAVNDKGVDRIAHVEIEFDPSYQTLTLHTLNLIRDGRSVAKLASAKIKVLQRERELESRIYDGTMTATAFLEDVRAGDAVEVAYSLRGWNSVFNGRQFGRAYLQWRAPVSHVHERLLLPVGRHFVFGQHNTKMSPVVSDAAGMREYVWDLHDIAALHMESSVPDWFDPYANFEWSEFRDWASVARWAEPLYAPSQASLDALRFEVDRIARANPDAQSRLVATLSFVQAQIRYMGVEVGPGSHAPNPPQIVLQRRYGDCKDKALLTVTMLRALGIEAAAVLVDTQAGRALNEVLAPSPGAFNHVIVRARVDGHDHWLDPTRRPQKGSLARISQADFGYALVLDGRSTGLVKMPAPASESNRRSVRMHFDARADSDSPIPLTVTTTYEGTAADWARDRLSPDKLEDAQRNYLNFYARSYPKITSSAPLQVSDDEAANRLTATERYLVPGLWDDMNTSGTRKGKALFYAPDMRSELPAPDEPLRKAPLAVSHPVDFTLTIEADLPGGWAIRDGNWDVEDSAFRFTKSVHHTDADMSRLTVTHHYQSLADHVPAANMAEHVEHLEQARDMAGYTLRADKREVPAFSRANAMIWLVFVLALAVIGVASRWFIRHVAKSEPEVAAIKLAP